MELERTKDESPAFNQGLDYISRLDELCKACNVFAVQNDPAKWFLTVQALFRELSPMMESEDEYSFKKIIRKAVNINTKKEAVYNYNTISEADIFLRKLMSTKGLLMPRKDDPGMAVLG